MIECYFFAQNCDENEELVTSTPLMKATFESTIDFSKVKLPNSVIDNFIERIVVLKNDTFEVDINLQNTYSQTIICGAVGRKNYPKLNLLEKSDDSPAFHTAQLRLY